jgi:hypothetical protein
VEDEKATAAMATSFGSNCFIEFPEEVEESTFRSYGRRAPVVSHRQRMYDAGS